MAQRPENPPSTTTAPAVAPPTQEDELFEDNLIEDVPDRPTSAPPVLEIHSDSLFAFRTEQQPHPGMPPEMHMMPHYQPFVYDAASAYGVDPSQIPPSIDEYSAAMAQAAGVHHHQQVRGALHLVRARVVGSQSSMTLADVPSTSSIRWCTGRNVATSRLEHERLRHVGQSRSV